MTVWEAILLGIIQGIFMFFPVSSTSHLALTQHWLISRGSEIPSPDSPEMIFFDLIVHVGTLVSMAVVFRKSLREFIGHLAAGVRSRFAETESGYERLYLKLAAYGLLSVAATGLIGFPLKAAFETIFASPLVMSGTLTVTGILLWWTDVLSRRPIGLRKINTRVALAIGVGQGLALMPGLSRSGTTIAFALFAGLKRRWAAEYSFFIAFPTILGASALQGLEVARAPEPMTLHWAPILVGFVVAAIVGVFALYLVLKLLYRARFRYFSFYVWALALVVAWSAHRGIL
ncbi:MAG: undecaprenyl-diphosphate phosphatase [Gemmatimonadetes bacterium]|nr:undecaprenyl-diphosphate phosphatase [Gemmatimonadota bacterium]